MQLSLSIAVAATLSITPLVNVTTDACYACHEGATRDAHPVAVEYRPRLYGESKTRLAAMPSGFGSTVANDMLVNGRIECTSCHASHEQQTDQQFRLRTSGDNPAPLCLACHALE